MNKLWIPVAGAAAVGLAAMTLLLPQNPVSAAHEQTFAKTPVVPPATSLRDPTHVSPMQAIPDFPRELDSATFDGDPRRRLEAWTQKDPAAALAWAARIVDVARRQQAQEIICLDLALRDPRKAVEIAIDTRLCDTDAGLLENLTMQWAARYFDDAHEWVRQQEAWDWREELAARVAFVSSKTDPAAAAQIVVGEIASGPRQKEAAISVPHQWALRDLEVVTAWANAFPAGKLRQRAQAEIEDIRKSCQTAATLP